MPVTESELLTRIDKGLEQMLGSQAEVQARIKLLEETNGKVEARLKVHDDSLAKDEEGKKEIQADINRKRLGTGANATGTVDALREAMPQEVRSQMPMLENLCRTPEGLKRRSPALASEGAADVWKLAACAWDLNCYIRSVLAASKGEGALAQAWR